MTARARRWIEEVRAWPQHKQLSAGALAALGAWAALEVVLGARATLVIVSTSGAPIVVSVDGATYVVPNVAAETPGAGLRVRVFPGARRLIARAADGRELESVDAGVARGRTYLWAPLATDQCFFVEHTAYGRAPPERPPLEALPEAARFWALPSQIDAWFVPTPRASDLDHRSTGGGRTVIRQARCGTTPFR